VKDHQAPTQEIAPYADPGPVGLPLFAPPRPPIDTAARWITRREQAWTAAGWLAAAVLAVVLVILILLAAHIAPALLGAR
jgi:hypothetical protein